MGGAVLGFEDSQAQTHVNDFAFYAHDLDGITYGVLFFQDNEEAGDQVSDQVLGAEADGQAQDAGAGDQGSDINAQLLHGGDEHYKKDRVSQEAAHQGGDDLEPAFGQPLFERAVHSHYNDPVENVDNGQGNDDGESFHSIGDHLFRGKHQGLYFIEQVHQAIIIALFSQGRQIAPHPLTWKVGGGRIKYHIQY